MHACMGSGARSSEDKGGNSNVEDDTTRSKLTYRERFIFEVLKQCEKQVNDGKRHGNREKLEL